jgi:hypothetical protein
LAEKWTSKLTHAHFYPITTSLIQFLLTVFSDGHHHFAESNFRSVLVSICKVSKFNEVKDQIAQDLISAFPNVQILKISDFVH